MPLARFKEGIMYYQTDLMAALRSVPWFVDLKPTQLERLVNISDLFAVDTDEELFSEGEKKDFLYVVLEGQVAIEVYVPTRGQVRIFTAEPLDILGWSSMTPIVRQRTASARAVVPSRLIGLESEGLYRYCEEDHDLGYVIMRRLTNVIASRLLTTRIHLMDLFVCPGQQCPEENPIPE